MKTLRRMLTKSGSGIVEWPGNKEKSAYKITPVITVTIMIVIVIIMAILIENNEKSRVLNLGCQRKTAKYEEWSLQSEKRMTNKI